MQVGNSKSIWCQVTVRKDDSSLKIGWYHAGYSSNCISLSMQKTNVAVSWSDEIKIQN